MAMAMSFGPLPSSIRPPLPRPSSRTCTFPPPRRCPWSSKHSRNSRRIQASSSSTGDGLLRGPFIEGELSRPPWTGDEPLSRFVNLLVSIRPLYSVMRSAARRVLIRSAEKKGIPWREMAEQCLASDVYAEKDLLENPTIVYPDYYLQEFHGYKEGNLSWKAAAEVEPATSSMVTRAFPAARTLEEANLILRGNWLKTIEDHHLRHSGGREITDILDIGCSVGVSTCFLADRFPSAQVTGLDLSPYFVAVAQHKEKQQAGIGLKREKSIRWLHANGEATGLPSVSFDIVSFAYVIHECPQHATRGLLKEALRLLRPGGTVALTDNAPKSKVLQRLPPVLFTLMKFTEPWMDEYYSMNVEEVMHEVGFINVKSILTDHRHRTITGTVPL